PLVLLLGCFPLFILAFPTLFKTILYPGHRGFVRWMKCLFWVVLILFSLVTTKIVHYSSLTYFPLAVLGALWLNQGEKISLLQKTVWALVALLWTIALFILPLVAGSESLQLQL